MNIADLATAVVDKMPSTLSKAVSVFVNRLVLRIYNDPSLMAFLNDVVVVADPEDPESANVELEFYRLPDEVIPRVMKVMGTYQQPEVLEYAKNEAARTGFRLKVSKEDFGDTDSLSYDF